ncbi:unnamed protein product [Heligmosomoides polygyrus]|uniref:Armadillo repeat-containing protein 6 n=1 Tax=Heligmosomoides polygyrus TaxID=6339 RepID=A0A3P8CL75_HELPZ|nr:unnamed protein product [Heligmosomoides polygyrus]
MRLIFDAEICEALELLLATLSKEQGFQEVVDCITAWQDLVDSGDSALRPLLECLEESDAVVLQRAVAVVNALIRHAPDEAQAFRIKNELSEGSLHWGRWDRKCWRHLRASVRENTEDVVSVPSDKRSMWGERRPAVWTDEPVLLLEDIHAPEEERRPNKSERLHGTEPTVLYAVVVFSKSTPKPAVLPKKLNLHFK